MDNQGDTTVPGIVAHLFIYHKQVQHFTYDKCSSFNKERVRKRVNTLLESLVNNPKIQSEWRKKFKSIGY